MHTQTGSQQRRGGVILFLNGGEYPPPGGYPTLPGGAWVFTEPAGGWVSEGPSAHLALGAGQTLRSLAGFGSNALVLSGSTALVPAALNNGSSAIFDSYNLPIGGWAGTVAPTASLISDDSEIEDPETARFVGTSVIASSSTGVGGSGYAPTTGIDLIPDSVTYGPTTSGPMVLTGSTTEVFSHVSEAMGTVTPSSTLSAAPEDISSGYVSVFTASTGGNIDSSTDPAVSPSAQLVHSESLEAATPRINTAQLTGAGISRPRLALKIHSSVHTAELSTLTILLPTGLSLVRSPATLRQTVAICRTVATTCSMPKSNALRVRFSSSTTTTTQFSIIIPAKALRETEHLKKELDSDASSDQSELHRRQMRSVRLRVAIDITNALGVKSKRAVTFHLR